MKVFNLKTQTQINSCSSRCSGTDMLMQLLVANKGNGINDVQFGTTSRGKIEYSSPSEIILTGCRFNYVNFIKVKNFTFVDCYFNECEFDAAESLIFLNCDGYIKTNYYSQTKDLLFKNCELYVDGLRFCSDVTIENCPRLEQIKQALEREKQEKLEAERKELELRKNLKGYKIVEVPCLIELSFPDDARIVNLSKSKSKADKAKVERIIPITETDKGITNYAYSTCNYIEGEIAYPDSFSDSPIEDCGHGIHFCKNIMDVTNYVSLRNAGYNRLQKIASEITNN